MSPSDQGIAEDLIPEILPVGIGSIKEIPTVDPLTVGVGVAFAFLSLLALALRILCTIKEARKPKIEEYGAVIGFVLAGAYMAVEMSLGYTSDHTADMQAFMFTTGYCIRLFIVVALAAPAVAAPKIALMSLLLRLLYAQRTAPWQNRRLRILAFVCVALSLVFACASVVVATLKCSAVDGTGWRPRLECSQTMGVMGIVAGAVGVVVNGAIILVAWRLVVGERSSCWRKKKKQLGVVGLSALPMVISSLLGMGYRIWIDGHTVMLWHGFVVQGCVYVDAYTTLILCCSPALQYFQHKKGCGTSLPAYLYSLFIDPPPPRRKPRSIYKSLRRGTDTQPPDLPKTPTAQRTTTAITTNTVSSVNTTTPLSSACRPPHQFQPPLSSHGVRTHNYRSPSRDRKVSMGTDEWSGSEMGIRVRRALEGSGLQGVLDECPLEDEKEDEDQEKGATKWPVWALDNKKEGERREGTE